MAITTVLYLSYDGMTDPLGQSQVIPYLEGLSQQGFRFHIISFEKPENFKAGAGMVESILKKSNITWHPLTYTKWPPVISTLYDLRRMQSKAEELLHALPIKIVHCRSYISGLAGLQMKKKYGVKFIFDMRGFYADERVDGGLWPQNNPVYKVVYNFFKKKEKQMLREADAVICLTNNAAAIISEWKLKGRNELPVHVIPCCADLNHFDASKINIERKNDLLIEHKLTGMHPVLVYLGAIGTWYMLDEMLAFFKKLIQLQPNAVFLFITHEPPVSIYKKAEQIQIPENRIRVVKAKRHEVPELLNLADAAIFFIKPTFSKQASSPTKQGEIMGMGIPIICNSGVGDTDYVINHYKAGLTADLNNPDAIDELASRFSELNDLSPAAIRFGAEDFYSLASGISKYKSVYNQLLSV